MQPGVYNLNRFRLFVVGMQRAENIQILPVKNSKHFDQVSEAFRLRPCLRAGWQPTGAGEVTTVLWEKGGKHRIAKVYCSILSTNLCNEQEMCSVASWCMAEHCTLQKVTYRNSITVMNTENR